MPRIYDISVPITTGGVVYPGNPEIRLVPNDEMTKGASSNLTLLSFGSHTGTHVDAPLHMIVDGTPVDELPLDRFIGPAIVVEVPDDVRAVDAALLRTVSLTGHRRVLLKTRNSALLAKREFVTDYTYLAPDGAEYLAELGIELVGIDYYSIEQYKGGHHRAHLALLERGIVIVEGLNLFEPNPGVYDFMCLPLRLVGIDGAPARAVLVQ